MGTSEKAKSNSTQIIHSKKKQSQMLLDFFSNAPAVFAFLKGPKYIFDFANTACMEFIGNRNIIGKPLREALPEIEAQGYITILDNVYKTRESFNGKEMPVMMDNGNGKLELFYLNFTFQAFPPQEEKEDEEDSILVFAYDVTEQVLARKLVEASEKRFSNILSQSLMAIAIFKGPDMVVAFANEQMINNLGKGDSILNKPLLEGVPELKDQPFPQLLAEVYTTGVPIEGYETKAVLIRKGIPVDAYFNFVYQPYRDVDDTITGITVLATEVTEQVLAKRQLEESHEKQKYLASQLKLATDSAKVGVWSFDPVSLKLDWSALHKRMWGFDEDSENLTYEDWHKVIVTEDKELAFERINQAKINHEIYDVEYRIKRANDGAIVWIRSIGQYYYDEFGTAHTLTGISIDITEQIISHKLIEESEAKFKNLSESIPHMIWTATPEGKKNFFNKYFLDYTGLQKEELVGHKWHKINFAHDLEEQLILWQDSIKTGKSFTFEKRILCHDGTYKWHMCTTIAQKDKQGNIIEWIGTNTNIDEQKRFAKELMEAKIYAEKATKLAEIAKTKAEAATEIAENAVIAKQQFLSNMSHEIRTPMNSIIGFTKVLMKTDLSDKQKEYLEAIQSSGNTLIVLINDILDLAKVDAGKMTFIDSPFKLSQTIATILHLFEPKILEMNLELVNEYDSKIPEILLGDSIRLHQILINLLSNAIKFTEKGKIILSVHLLNENKENVTLKIKVMDTGIGIPQNKITSIFENFEQASPITSSLYGGTGLGLAIVKQLVEKQGGTISVKSKVNEGSIFSITLSFQKTNAKVDIENGERNFNKKINPLKVLVVEDVKLNQLLLRTILDDFKFDWDIADNGEIAIEKLIANSYDIILMDLQMPILNGFEATKIIRNKLNLQIPIIALTADVTTVDVEKCKAAGMNDYISKPIDEQLLYSKIINLVNSNF